MSLQPNCFEVVVIWLLLFCCCCCYDDDVVIVVVFVPDVDPVVQVTLNVDLRLFVMEDEFGWWVGGGVVQSHNCFKPKSVELC